MENLRDPEEKVLCPYNSSHHIRRCRLNTHLVKCKKSYPNTKLVQCDFNVNHKVPEPELQYHHENCCSRKDLEVTFVQEEGVDLKKFAFPPTQVDSEESWDDLNVPAYNPQEYCEKNDVLRKLDVESAAKRKNFRISERKRINDMAYNKPDTYEPIHQPSRNRNRDEVISQINLPDKPRAVVFEKTPDDISDLMNRLNLGAKRSFVPKAQK